jgi:hypothetical protein
MIMTATLIPRLSHRAGATTDSTAAARYSTIWCVDLHKLSKSERQLWQAFPRGELVDLAGARGSARDVRAEVIGALLRAASRSSGICLSADARPTARSGCPARKSVPRSTFPAADSLTRVMTRSAAGTPMPGSSRSTGIW